VNGWQPDPYERQRLSEARVIEARCPSWAVMFGAYSRRFWAFGAPSLSVLGDDIEFFETYAEINVINPARPDRGTVRVNDDGALYWHYCLQSPETDGDGVMLAAAHDSRVGAA
jgi:hypothetical protein